MEPTMPDRCAPPDDNNDLWHWLNVRGAVEVAHWLDGAWVFAGDEHFCEPEEAHDSGIRYIAPCGRPDIVAALREENARLRAALRPAVDFLESLLEAGKFPGKGHSTDDKDSVTVWWEDRWRSVKLAHDALAPLPEKEPQP